MGKALLLCDSDSEVDMVAIGLKRNFMLHFRLRAGLLGCCMAHELAVFFVYGEWWGGHKKFPHFGRSKAWREGRGGGGGKFRVRSAVPGKWMASICGLRELLETPGTPWKSSTHNPRLLRDVVTSFLKERVSGHFSSGKRWYILPYVCRARGQMEFEHFWEGPVDHYAASEKIQGLCSPACEFAAKSKVIECVWKPQNVLLRCAVVMEASLRHDRIASCSPCRDLDSIVALDTKG